MINLRPAIQNSPSIAPSFARPVSLPTARSVYFGHGGDNDEHRALPKKLRFLAYLSPVINLLGGGLLMASQFIPAANLPANANPASQSPPAAVAQATVPSQAAEKASAADNSSPEAMATRLVSSQIESLLPQFGFDVNQIDWKTLLAELGWSLSSIGQLAAGANWLAYGLRSKQPSMALGGMLTMGAGPLLAFDPTLAIRGTILLGLALSFTSFGNIRANETRKKGEPAQEFDMKPLYSPQALRELIPDQSTGKKALAAAWMKQAAGMARFIAADQVLTAQAPYKLAKDLGKAAKRNKANTEPTLKQTLAKHFTNSSPEQNRLSALLMTVGSVPMILVAGSAPEVGNWAAKAIGAGTIGSSLSLFQVGMKGKQKIDRTLLLAAPLCAVGATFVNTVGGYGGDQFADGMISGWAGLRKVEESPETHAEHTQEAEHSEESEHTDHVHTETESQIGSEEKPTKELHEKVKASIEADGNADETTTQELPRAETSLKASPKLI